VILAGGSGKRLWPMSRQQHPKQFLSLVSKLSLLQQTIIRIAGLEAEKPIVLCGEDHRFLVAEQLRDIMVEATIVVEPISKGTAPATGIAASLSDPDSILLILPADHVIRDEAEFIKSVRAALLLADQGFLMTLGVVPESPNTEYGYIEKGQKRGAAYEVKGFVEKPSSARAQRYLETGNFLWNAGIFLFKSRDYLDALNEYHPEIAQICTEVSKRIEDRLDFCWLEKDLFDNCLSISIDVAVMERTNSAAVVPLSAGWSDIGSWGALWDYLPKEKLGNHFSEGVIALKSQNSLVKGGGGRLVAVLGISDLVVIDTEDAVLVASKESLPDLKELVGHIEKQGRTEHSIRQNVHRPWGRYETKDRGEKHLVKRICVNSKASLSLQKHNHRAEHWIVVKGVAEVTRNSETFLLQENQSTFLPIGSTHSLRNPGDEILEIIEVQTGSYLSEDDIVRLEDKYGRQ
jgi:mannose-1-phosphate guanylyltransferase/mannose-6-phosphate isomerase